MAKNNKGKPTGAGTVSNARRERYKQACQERDRVMAETGDLAKAKQAQKVKRQKPVEAKAPAPCQKEHEVDPLAASSGPAPCQKEQGSQTEEPAAPCQKEQPKEEPKAPAPCQKEQAKEEPKAPAPCQKEYGKEEEPKLAPCQKGQAKEEPEKKQAISEAPAPSHKEKLEETNAPCQKELGPSTKQVEQDAKVCKRGMKLEHDQGVSSTDTETAPEVKRAKQPEPPPPRRPQAKAWVKDGHRWITKDEANKRIAIDYFQTLIKGNGKLVHWKDRQALQMLKDHGYFLILLSYCGIERAEEITQALHDQDLMQYFDQVKFTWKKTGPQGKAVYCRDNHIRFLIDDSPDIVDECWDMGIYTYNINTRWHVHTAGHWHFWEAADQFLIDQDHY